MNHYYKTPQMKLAEYYMIEGALKILDYITCNSRIINELNKSGESDKRLMVELLITSVPMPEKSIYGSVAKI